MSRHFAVFFWLGLAFGASPENIAGRMRALHVPGAGIAVMQGGKIAWTAGYGDKVNPQTLFQAASISKPVAAMAALHMAQNGNFTLDEDVNAKLKTWKVPKGKVTLRMLLSHSAGMTVHGFPGYEVDAPVPTLLQILDGGKPSNSAPVRVDIEPGSKWRYSGGGFAVVQQLMMDRMGWAFPQILQRMVLGRIGMRRSTYEQPLPEGMRENAATGHDRNGNPIKGRWHVYPEMAAAGLWTTPTDLALWAIEVREAYFGRSNKILERSMAREMLTRQKGNWGLGVQLRGEGAALNFGHGGSNAGFQCALVMLLESGNGAVVMTNGDQGGKLATELIREIANEHHWPAGWDADGR